MDRLGCGNLLEHRHYSAVRTGFVLHANVHQCRTANVFRQVQGVEVIKRIQDRLTLLWIGLGIIVQFRVRSAGNVYGNDEDFDAGELRYSVGLSGIWVSPFGLVSASIAQPIADQAGDDIQNFQFTFGTSF